LDNRRAKRDKGIVFMRLPRADVAHIEKNIIVEYLLNPIHPEGASKAHFFMSLGFAASEWEKLADALRQVALDNPIANTVETIHGRKYIIEGVLTSPSTIPATVRTVWIGDQGDETPRLVTAYPYAQR
jgi:hypothetical protein